MVENKVFYVIIPPGSDRTALNQAISSLKTTYEEYDIKFEIREEDLDIEEADNW